MSPTKPRLLRLEGRGSWDTTLPATSSTGAAMTEGAVRTDKQRVACSIGGALGALGDFLSCLHLFIYCFMGGQEASNLIIRGFRGFIVLSSSFHILFHWWPRGL